jgi:hypothetical protein
MALKGLRDLDPASSIADPLAAMAQWRARS